MVEHLLKIEAHVTQNATALAIELHVAEVVTQGAAHEKFHGEVIETLGVSALVARFRLHHLVNKAIANGEGDRFDEVSSLEFALVARQRITDVPGNGFPEVFRRPYLSHSLNRHS